MEHDRDLNGLGGWLILVGIGTVISPFRLLSIFIPLCERLFSEGTWAALTSVDSELYHPLWAPLLIGEIAFNSLTIIASFCLIYLFFAKHSLFPRLFIAIILATVVFIPMDAWLGSYLFPNEPIFDPATSVQFARSVFVAIIWVPYMLLSKRVHATFGKPILASVHAGRDEPLQADGAS